jgi:hypothetical protein
VTLYVTNTNTGEMTPLNLAPLAHEPKGKVHRLPSPRRAHATTYRTRKPYSRPQPLGDLAIGVGCALLALAILLTLAIRPA